MTVLKMLHRSIYIRRSKLELAMFCHPVDKIHIEQQEIRTVSTKTRQCQTLRFCLWNGASGDLPDKLSVHCIAQGF